jgi:two-component system response regulator AtoC
VIEYAVNICQDEIIDVQHLPVYLSEAPATMRRSEAEPAAVFTAAAASPAPARSWRETERRMILDALVKAGGRRSQAAEILGWGRSTLWRKMKQYEMDGS